MHLSYRLLNAFLLFASIVGMAFALYLEHGLGLEPCPLCIFQRLGLIGLGLFSLINLIHAHASGWVKRIYAGLASLSILWSAAVAARHVWLQQLPADQVPSCGPGLDYWLDALPLLSVMKNVLSGSGECAAVKASFLSLSLPFWSLLFFSLLAVVALYQLFRKPD